jgi:aspartate ammonia-lyase
VSVQKYRVEHDLLGELDVPVAAYWGIHTQRALGNFALSPRKVNAGLIHALALVKKACCFANVETFWMKPDKAQAISDACDEVASGRWDSEFPLDAMQGGAGTSTNMNVNEVIANRAIEILNGEKGDYSIVNPIDDINLHQSTNDVYPTAVKVAAIYALRRLSRDIAALQGEFQKKEKEFGEIVKMGRTEMQEAVPLTLGMEFSAFSEALGRDRWRAFKCEERLRVVNLGGTAIGTGISAPKDYIFLVIEKLRDVTGLGLSRGENLAGETANADAFVEVSGIMKAHASNLIKIAGDLRLMNMLGEIRLPSMQAGSSAMPGKINPVIAEAVIQAGIRVVANDLIVTEAANRSTFQIIEFMPMLADALLESMDILSNVDIMLAGHVSGISADAEKCAGIAHASPMIITALVPYIGYEKATEIINGYKAADGKDFRTYLKDLLGEDLVDRALDPYSLTALGFKGKGPYKK